jgi:hypothetical protein
MSQHAVKTPPTPDFVPTLAWAAALMVLLQLTGSTSWMLVPPGLLALGAFVSWQRLPGAFFASMPISLWFETTGFGIEDIAYVIMMMGDAGLPQNRKGYVSMGIENLASIVLWFALGMVWIGGFRELAHSSTGGTTAIVDWFGHVKHWHPDRHDHAVLESVS